MAGDRRRGQLRPPLDVEPRIATADDVSGVVTTLTESFLDDPMMRWSFPDDGVRHRRLAVLWRFMADGIYLPGGACTTLPGHDAVALWRRPGAPPADEYWAEHGERFAEAMEGDLERMRTVAELMAEHRPSVDHWYLLAVGVRPEVQGRGLGGVLLAHTLEQIDAAGEPAYLEATSPRSRRLYARFGFEVTAELAPVDGPPLWPMWRA